MLPPHVWLKRWLLLLNPQLGRHKARLSRQGRLMDVGQALAAVLNQARRRAWVSRKWKLLFQRCINKTST